MEKQVNKIKKILVAIDFSIYSRSTLEYALAVAKNTKGRIMAVNIINQTEIDSVERAINTKYPDVFSLAKYLPKEMGKRKLKMEALIREVSGAAQLPVEIRIGNGKPHVEILKTIDQEKIDFLVFGPRGRSNLREFIFGSVAEKLFRHSPVPVISLRYPSE